MATQKPRQIAVNILRRHSERIRFIEPLVDSEVAAAQLEPVDGSLVRELAYGAVRWQSTLDWLIARKAKQPTQKNILQIILRISLYQIFWLDRVPDHAIVNEAVDLAREFGFSGQSGFVNALLRDYIRERDDTVRLLEDLKDKEPALGYSHPDWLCERWRKYWDTDKMRKLLEWNNTPAPTYARRNALKASTETLTEAWKSEGVEFIPREFDWTGPDLVYEIQFRGALDSLESFQQGYFYVQDPSTLLAVNELNPQPKEAVLDFCAAPGGKTTYIAQRMNNEGYIMAQDLDIHRRNAIKENCLRLGVSIVNISRATTAINHDLSKPFDKILVDAPCSNTGVMRRRVDLRWRVTLEELERLRTEQLDIMDRACLQVRKGGTLVYSTCSLEPEENSELIKEFLKEHPQFELKNERELLPFVDKVDGGYVARLRLQDGEHGAAE